MLISPHTRYLKKELKKIENPKFDILFSINAHIVCRYLFRKLKSINPKLYSVLYLWDSFAMYDWKRELKFFDKVFTFDSIDAINYKIEYKPNFYLRNNINTSHKNEYDLFFAGKFSTYRLAIIDNIINMPEVSGIKLYVRLWPAYKIFFHKYFLYFFFRALNLRSSWIKNYQTNFEAIEGILNREYLVDKSINFEELQYHLLCSNVILDIPYQLQAGYTHRVIEALANGRKVITTNSNIRQESFYNPDQIHIIDNQKPEIDCGWIRQKSAFPVSNYFFDLELSEWLKSIVNVGIA